MSRVTGLLVAIALVAGVFAGGLFYLDRAVAPEVQTVEKVLPDGQFPRWARAPRRLPRAPCLRRHPGGVWRRPGNERPAGTCRRMEPVRAAGIALGDQPDGWPAEHRAAGLWGDHARLPACPHRTCRPFRPLRLRICFPPAVSPARPAVRVLSAVPGGERSDIEIGTLTGVDTSSVGLVGLQDGGFGPDVLAGRLARRH